MARLRGRGYRFVQQAEFARKLHAGEPLEGLASATFDDGPEDNATTLPALLEELELPATLYICPGLLGQPYPWVAPHTGIRILDRGQLERVAAHPLVEVGSHTNDHALLGDASEERAFRAMTSSKCVLEELLGREVVSFAYPDGLYSAACPGAAERAGYSSAVVCGPRGGLTPYELSRVSPTPTDGALAFHLKMRGVFHRVRSLPEAGLARFATRRLRYGD